MKMLHGAVLLGLGCMVLGGCADTVNTYSTGGANVTDADAPQVTNIRKSTVSGDLLRVQADVVNTKSSDRVFNYRFEWFDEDNNQLDSQFEGWKALQIGPRETITVTGTATNPRAVDFRLKIILGKRQ